MALANFISIATVLYRKENRFHFQIPPSFLSIQGSKLLGMTIQLSIDFLPVLNIDICHKFFVVFVIVFLSLHEVACDHELTNNFNIMDKNNNAIEIVKSLPDYEPIPKTAG